MAAAEEQKKKTYTVNQVAEHREYEDCWIILGEKGERKVYDISAFLDDHPGGPEILMDLAGQDANEEFEDIGHSNDARDMLAGLCIGELDESGKPTKILRNLSSAETVPETAHRGNHMLLIIMAFIVLAFGFLFRPVE